MAWDKWLKDENEEPSYPQIEGIDTSKEYAQPEVAALHNGAFSFLKSFPNFGAQWAHELGSSTNPKGLGVWDKAPQIGITTPQDEVKPIENSFAPTFHTLENSMLSAANSLPEDWTPNQDVGKVRGFFDTVLENAPQMVGQAAMAAVSPTASAAMMAASISGDTYGDLLSKGVDPDTASKYATANTLIQTPLEYTGMESWLNSGKLARDILEKHGLAKAVGTSMASEGLTEAIQEIPDEMTRYIAEHGNLDGFDYKQLGLNAAEAGAVGAFYGGLFSGAGYGINKWNEKKAKEAQEAVTYEPTGDLSTDIAALDKGVNSNGVAQGNDNAPTTINANNPSMYVMQRLVNEGIDPQTAAGYVGALMQESGGNTFDISPTAENPSGAYGIAQWLGSRKDDLIAFANERGKDPSDFETQVEFLVHEIQGNEKESLAAIRGAKSPEEAGMLADQYYERSEGTDEIRNQKAKNARAIYDAFTNGSGNVNMSNGIKTQEKPSKSAAEFLNDLESTLPLTNNESVAQSEKIRDVVKNGSQEQQEELASQYGWQKEEPKTPIETQAEPPQVNTQNATTKAPEAKISNPTSTKKQAKASTPNVTVKTPNLAKEEEKKATPVEATKAEPQKVETKSAGVPKNDKTQNANTVKIENAGGVYPTPTSFDRNAFGIHNPDGVGTAPEGLLVEKRKTNGIADRQRHDAELAGARNRQVGIKVDQAMMGRGIRNKNLKKLVKQAFVDGDKSAVDRLSALKLNPQVIGAVRQEVDPTYTPTPIQKAPVQKVQTPTYQRAYNGREGIHEGVQNTASNSSEIPSVNGGSSVVGTKAMSREEALNTSNAIYKNNQKEDNPYKTQSVERNKKADKELKKKMKNEARDAHRDAMQKKARDKARTYEAKSGTREDVNKSLRNSGDNIIIGEAHKKTSSYEAKAASQKDNESKSLKSDSQSTYTGRPTEGIEGNVNKTHNANVPVDTPAVLKKARQKHIDHLKKLVSDAYIGGDKEAMRRLSALHIGQDVIDSILQDVYPSHATESAESNEWGKPSDKTIPLPTTPKEVMEREPHNKGNENSYSTSKVKKNKEAEHALKNRFKKEETKKENTNETTKNNPEIWELLHSAEENQNADTEPKQSSKQESNADKASEEKQSVNVKEQKKEEPKKEEPKQEKSQSVGKEVTVRTDDGKEFKATYKIVPVDDVISSNTWDFGKNENYPEELQPRDRDRVTMREQVDDMSRNLNPADLAESRSINEGAPLINADNVVENGNGRTMAIARAYKQGSEAYKTSGENYKQYLVDNAEKFGYTKEQVQSIENPILVRQRDVSSDNLQDSIIHSTNGGMRMGATQQAQADAEKITQGTLKKYNYDGKGDLTSAANRDFVVSAINEIANKNERDSLFDKGGNPSAEGMKRVQNAMVALAYENDELLARVGETVDPEDLNISNALKATAPRVASIQLRIDEGDIPQSYNLPKTISDAVEFYFNCKAEGKKVSQAINETALFEDEEISEDAKQLAKFFEENKRKPNVIANAINDMVERIDANTAPSMSLMEGGNMTMGEIMDASMYPNSDLFETKPVETNPTVKKASDDMQNVVDKYKDGKGNKPTANKAVDAIEKKAIEEVKKDGGSKEDVAEVKKSAKQAKEDLANATREKGKKEERPFSEEKDANSNLAALLKPVKRRLTKKPSAKKAPTAEPKRKKGESSLTHKLIDDSDENRKAIWDEFKNNLGKKRFNSGFDPTLLTPIVKLAVIELQRGIGKFKDFASRIKSESKEQDIKEEDISPWLYPSWRAAKGMMESSIDKINDKLLLASMDFVGSRYQNGKTNIDDIKKDAKSLYGEDVYNAANLDDYFNASHDAVVFFFNNENSEVESNKISDTIDTDTSTVVENKGEEQDVPGRERSTGGTVEMAGRRQSEQSGTGNREESGNDSEGKNRDSGRTHGEHAGSAEQADAGTVQGQRNSNEATDGVEQNDSTGNETGRAKEPVISPKVDKIEKDIANNKVKKPSDLPGNDYVFKDDTKELTAPNRVKANIEAIKLAKKLKEEGRKATPSEQEILASYSGWGGLSSYLSENSSNYDAKIASDLKEAIGEDAYRDLAKEAITAYYTPVPVIKAMWKLAGHLGFKGGRVLDPSCGTARFFSVMPNDMKANSRTLQGVELSELPAEIASQLLQSRKYNIANEDFRDFKASNDFYDLAISNVPFSADIKIADKSVDGGNKYSLHNYFFAKSLDKVRPGGLVIFMTSNNTLDVAGDSSKLRRMLAGKAELLGAIRLPTDTFKSAGANVVTDIIAFRKLGEGESMKADSWKDVTGEIVNGNYVENDIGPSGYIDEEGRPHVIKDKTVTGYYGKHKQNLIGEYKREKGKYGDTVTVRAKEGQDVIADLNKAIDTFPKDVYSPRVVAPINSVEHVEGIRQAENGENEGDLVALDDGSIAKVQNVNGELKAVPFGANYKRDSDRKRVQNLAKDFVAVRDAMNDVYESQVNPDISEEELEKKRANLRKAYNNFKEKHGYLNDTKNYGPFRDTPLVGRVLAIENYKAPTKKNPHPEVKEADILTKRTAYPESTVANITTPADALLSSLEKFGHIDMDYMAKTLGVNKEDIAKKLEGKIIKDPVSEQYVPMDEYLSGNVRQKLEQAETAARSDPTYLDNAEKLKAILPKDIELKDIDVSLGSPILGRDTVQQFIDDLVGGKDIIKISYNPTLSSWYVEKGTDYGRIATNVEDKYSIKAVGEKEANIPVYKVIQDLLNGTSSVGQGTTKEKSSDTPQERQKREDARQKLKTIYEQINKDLKEWINRNPSIRKEVETNYNNRFNATVGRKFDGSFLTFPWLNKASNIAFRPHQVNAIWRTLTTPGTLYAHCVGTGKTWTMQASGMELKRLGLAHKVAYAVPNNVVAQFEREFYQICPSAKILVVSSDAIPSAPKTLDFDYILQKQAKPTEDNGFKLVNMTDTEGMKVYKKVPVPKTEAERKKLLKEALAEAKKNNAPQVLLDYIADCYSKEKMKLRGEREEKIAKRAAAISKIATNDWDAVIFSHESFERLPVAKEHLEEFYKNELAKYEQALKEEQAANGKNSQGAKDIQKQLLNFKEKLRDLIERTERFGAMEEFRSIGIDQLFVDEADNFKNLPFMTKMNRVKGISSGESSRALDMFIKTQYLMNSPNAHGVVFATGTPISNSVVDLYTMCRYLASDKLEALGINSFDQFAKMFITVADRATPKTDGTGYEYKQSVTGLKNAPECIELFRSFADVINIEDAPEVLKSRPVAKRETVTVDETPWLANFKRKIRNRAAAIKASSKNNPVMIDSRSKESLEMFEKTGHYKKVKDSGLLLANDYKQATVSPKLIENGIEDVESKVRACADAIYKEYINSNDRKGTQAVFCDIGTPGTKKSDSAYTVYDELKSMLVAKGIPANEIDFSQNYEGKKKGVMSEKVNAGDIRVIIGSTQQMGAGTNMQKKMVALHHLDVPWRPRDIEQREGRAIRQGNENSEVRIYNYVQEGSYDTNLWNMMSAKANVIAAIMHGDKSIRTIETEGVDSNNWQELESMSNNDPVQKRFMEVQAEISQLASDKRIYQSQKEQNEIIRKNNPAQIEKHKALVSDIEADIKAINQTDPKKFSMKIGNKTFDKREAANEALTKEKQSFALEGAKFVRKYKDVPLSPVTIGSVRGMSITLDGNTVGFKNMRDSAHVDILVKGKQAYRVVTPTSDGIWKGLQYLPTQMLEEEKQKLASLESELKEANKPMSETFEGEKELANLKKELEVLKKKMDENAAKQRREDAIAKEKEMQSAESTDYLISDTDSLVSHSPKEMQEQVMKTFPNASNVVTSDTGMEFDLPNGEHMKVDFTNDSISYDARKAQKDYGGKLTGNEEVLGSMAVTDRENLMTLRLDNVSEAPSHEAMHFAMNFVTGKERNALMKKYGNEEAICEAYRHWQIERKHKRGTLMGKVFQKIADAVNKVLSVFRENDKNIFRKVQEGQMWERARDNKSAAKVSYMMNPMNQLDKFAKEFSEKKANAPSRDYLTIKDRASDNGWTFKQTALNNIFSPARSTDYIVRRVHELADDAMRTMQKDRADWTERHSMAVKLLKTEAQRKEYSALLFAEDAEKHVFTDEEMRKDGISEEVIQAHRLTRSLLSDIYKSVNDVYTQAMPVTKTYAKKADAEKRIKEAEKSPFEEVIGRIHEVTENGKTRYQVTVKTPHSYDHEVVTDAKGLKEIQKDKYNVISTSVKVGKGKIYVHYKSYAKPLTNMEGYMPHFFHDFMIIQKTTDENGNTVSKVVGSATTQDKAVEKADALHKEMGGEFLIAPKSFQFEGEVENPLLMGDKDYQKLLKNITDGSTMTLEQARELTNARRKGRHVFLGELKKRTGAGGFETNALWAVQHHIDASARYVALDPFKVKATNLFERAYGDMSKDYGRTSKQAFVKGYIDSMLGKPSEAEQLANKILRHVPMFKNMSRPGRFVAGTLSHLTGLLKLGASPAAGLVNLMQIFNAVGYLGTKQVAVGLKRAMKPTQSDLRILKSLGVDDEVGLSMDSAFGKIRLEENALTHATDRYRAIADKLMLPFTIAERLIRRATVLSAYYKYLNDHKGENPTYVKNKAKEYALDINRKVNFDYSAADAPRIFRAVEGSVIGDLALQFQKYGVKEIEVISDFLPYIGKGTTTKQKLEFFGFYLMTAGLWNAFPFQDALLALLGSIFGVDDPEKVAKKAMMEWAGNDPTSKALVNVANYGAGALVGADISQRVGLKGVVPETSNILQGGPLGSTAMGIARSIINSDTNGALKSLSPAIGNIYGATVGYNTDSKGRKTVDYDGWDRAMRAMGFRTVNEAMATDAQGIVYNYKQQKTKARTKAKEAYLEDPSYENRKLLKDLGYTDSQINKLKDNKSTTKKERSKQGLSKADQKELAPIFNYVQ